MLLMMTRCWRTPTLMRRRGPCSPPTECLETACPLASFLSLLPSLFSLSLLPSQFPLSLSPSLSFPSLPCPSPASRLFSFAMDLLCGMGLSEMEGIDVVGLPPTTTTLPCFQQFGLESKNRPASQISGLNTLQRQRALWQKRR